jgi:hypothetical protein
MNNHRVLQKFIRSLHRNIFQSVPNDGPTEVDLSRLQPAQNATLEMPVFALNFSRPVGSESNVAPFRPEPWKTRN